MRQQRALLSSSNDTAKAINYLLNRWAAFTRFLDDGRVCLSNNAAERALRGVAVGRKNWTFAGSDAGGHRAAAVYTLDRNLQDERCRPASLACRRAGPASRSSRQQSRRPASMELEIGTSAERRGSLNTRRLIESPA